MCNGNPLFPMSVVTRDTDRKTIQAVDRTFHIIELIQTNNGVTLTDLTTEFGFSKSTIYYHLNTLMKYGYVTREDGEYRIGLRFLDPAVHAINRNPEYQIIKPKVKYLADETNERAQFITEENGVGIHVFSEIGENGVQSESRVGKTVYLHTTSAGKAMLASMPEDRINRIIKEYGLPKMTEQTITSRGELFSALEEIRERGYAVNRAERKEGLMAIGTSINDSSGKTIGAISVTGPLRRMEGTHEEHLPELLLDVSEEIQLKFEFPQN